MAWLSKESNRPEQGTASGVSGTGSGFRYLNVAEYEWTGVGIGQMSGKQEDNIYYTPAQISHASVQCNITYE
jgi:hypothetical protein